MSTPAPQVIPIPNIVPNLDPFRGRIPLTIPLSNSNGHMTNLWMDVPKPMSPGEWEQFLTVLSAMRPALVDESSREDSGNEQPELQQDLTPAADEPPHLSQAWMDQKVALVHDVADTVTGPEVKACTERSRHEPHLYDEHTPYPLFCPGNLPLSALRLATQAEATRVNPNAFDSDSIRAVEARAEALGGLPTATEKHTPKPRALSCQRTDEHEPHPFIPRLGTTMANCPGLTPEEVTETERLGEDLKKVDAAIPPEERRKRSHEQIKAYRDNTTAGRKKRAEKKP